MLHAKRFWRTFSSLINFSKNKTMNLNKCYFRLIKEENKVDISFLLRIKDAVRQFNFSRNTTESLGNIVSRIENNIQKVLKKSNKKKDCDSLQTKIEIKLSDEQGNLIPLDITCLDLFTLNVPLKLQVLENVYQIAFNTPWILNLSLPQSMLAGFPIYPETFIAQYADRQNSTFQWYSGKGTNEKGNVISDIHIKWKLVGSGFTFTPTNEEIGLKLKLECIPGNGKEAGPAFEIISKNAVEAGPGHCPFETRQIFTQTKLLGSSFRCVTYNILADLYCDSDYTRATLHPYCPPYALHIDYRKQLIIKELTGYNADIICLQEVDSKIFNKFLKPLLDVEGFCGIFLKKGKEVAEGLSCFFRIDRFRLLTNESIWLADAIKSLPCLIPIWDKIKNNDPLLKRLLDRSTVASATILQSIDRSNEIIVVGNTHLYFHPDSCHIRLLQGGIVIYWLNSLRHELAIKNPNKRISLILCGDFNSVPSRGIYKLYTTGEAPDSLPDWCSYEPEAVHGLTLKQEVLLESACGTPQYTNFTTGFADCLDYIFYEPSRMTVEQIPRIEQQECGCLLCSLCAEGIEKRRVIMKCSTTLYHPFGCYNGYEVVPLPSLEELQEHVALPSVVFPSDHISLISDLRFK